MSHHHSDKFSQKGGKCLTVIMTSFHKKEENVPWSFCNDKFLQKGGKCPNVIPTSFHKKEENVSPLFCQGLKKRRRKMSLFPFYQVLDMEGKFS